MKLRGCMVGDLLLVPVLLVAATVPAIAHHGTAASYDQNTQVTVTGVVTEFRWRNPHSSLHLDITESDGKVTQYAIELASPGLMARQGGGWTRRTFTTGDKVTFKVHPSKTGAPVGECLFNCEVTINGRKVTNAAAGSGATEQAPTGGRPLP